MARARATTPDIEAFERQLSQLDAQLARGGEPLFSGAGPVLVARAPGRLDVMGGIADYSGSLTLEMPIAEAAFACVQRSRTPGVRLVSASFGVDAAPLRTLHLSSEALRQASSSYEAARSLFASQPRHGWAAYVAGALVALQLEQGVPPPDGLELVVCSSVPEGKGVSSSAAVEVACYQALAALAGIQLPPIELALACQRVENRVVGAPCGAMDQLTSSCGQQGQLLPILCQPAQLGAPFPVPDGLHLWGIDSGLRHRVSGADYTEVRVAAFMGYVIIARALGFPVRTIAPGQLAIEDARYRGYLANVGVDALERELLELLPERLSGDDFLRTHGGIPDPVTLVRPSAAYRVRAATVHPIREHARATEFRTLMQSRGVDAGPRLGELMYQAHDGYAACGLGSSGTDRLVQLVREAGPARGLFGAKITGGGSGGTVAVLGASEAESAVRDVSSQYARESGLAPQLFFGSSPGAAQFGVRRVLRTARGFRVEPDEAGSA